MTNPSAVVTGAAAGIGRAITERLLAAGTPTIAVDMNEAGLTELSELGATTVSADLADPCDVARVIAAALGTNFLVNAAGITGLGSPETTPDDTWRLVFRVNTEAPYALIRGISPSMTSGAAIVNVASIAARLSATPEVAAYSASKAALVSITRTFAHSLAARGIRVNAVCPGIIDTPMQDAVNERMSERRGVSPAVVASERLARIPLARAGSASEVADVIAYLLSSESSYVTGQTINVDGGWVMS